MEILSKGGNNTRNAPSISILKTNPEFSSSEDSCDTLSFTTSIHPHEPGVKALKVNDLVKVELGENNRIEIYNNQGELCGFLSPGSKVTKLINCIKLRNSYSGVISDIFGKSYEVTISRSN